MARRLFFVPSVRREVAELHGDLAQHLTRVLRVEKGQVFEISDNEQLYLAEVELARKEHVTFRILERMEPRPEPFPVTLYVSLFKFDHLEWLIEKATELGVGVIQPIVSERTEHGLERAAVKRTERWRRIALEASQQSRRMKMPEVRELLDWKQALGGAEGLKLWLDERPGGQSLLTAMQAARPTRVTLLLGPEGGWSEREALEIAAAEWLPTSLGSLVLRAETAGIAALALVQASGSAGRENRS